VTADKHNTAIKSYDIKAYNTLRDEPHTAAASALFVSQTEQAYSL